MIKNPEIPCFFQERICPPDCPLYEKNKKNIEQIASDNLISFGYLCSLLTDPDQSIGLLYNEHRHAGWSPEALEHWRAEMYKTVNKINQSRLEYGQLYLNPHSCRHKTR